MIQDDDNTYVYGLDLISATDGAGVSEYEYDVFGAIRSQSGTGDTFGGLGCTTGWGPPPTSRMAVGT